MLRVDIGCGTNKPENFLGVDIYPAPGVDIVADISKNFPFNDSSVDELRAYDVIEHLPDRINTMNEIWRVCKAGATVDISVPSTDGRGAFQDPTHISFWNINSFFYYCVEYPIYLELCQRYGFKGAFQIIKLEHENSSREIIHVKAKLKVIKPVPNLQKKDKNNESIRGDNFQKTTELPSQIQAKSQNQQLLDRLFYCSQRYQQDPDHHSALAELKQSRKQVSEEWLSVKNEDLETQYLGSLGRVHKIILDSRIKREPLSVYEQSFVDEIKVRASTDCKTDLSIQDLLVLMLYYRAEELPYRYNLSQIPAWLIDDYLKLMLDPKRILEKLGEAENYFEHIRNFINELHHSIINDSDSYWRNKIAEKFLGLSNFIPLYFTDRNLKNVYVNRAEIVEFFLKQNNHKLDCDFSERTRNNEKIRLGILASHFSPAAETFASLPIYEYISREFEVILYSLHQTNTPLEQYCRLCANSFKLLPSNLEEQVKLIRADDLDILFVGTNVTAYINQIFLLSSHRLARIQMTSVASVVTTGIRNIDYYLSGELTDHLETAQQHYQEKLVKLRETAHCFSYGPELPQITTKVDRQSLGIGSDRVIFISGANFFKIIPELIETWAKIIASVPNSVLVLMPFGPNWSNTYPKKSFIKQLNHRFTQHGIQTERLFVLDPNPVPNRDDVKEYLKIANIYLDSYPFSGTTSLIEPLQVGLPIISRQGTSFRSSMGVAILQSLNVPDLVTVTSEESYIELAVTLGTNSDFCQQISSQIQKKMKANPTFLDSKAYSSQVGEVFKRLFQDYLIDNLPENLRLGDINLIIFPDLSRPEDTVGIELQEVIKSLVTHPDRGKMILLVDHSNIAAEDADLVLSSVAMNLLMEEEVEFDGGPEIVLIGELSPIQWSALIPKLQGRIELEHENENAIAQVQIHSIPTIELDT